MKNPLTAFTLQNKVLHDMARQGDLSACSTQIKEMTLKNDKQIRRMELLLDQIISLVDPENSVLSFPGSSVHR